MKSVVFAPFATWTPHFETDVELVLRLQQEGQEVHVVQCQKELPVCAPNQTHSKLTCALCFSRSESAFNLAGVPKDQRHFIQWKQASEESPSFASLEELMAYTWNGLEAGKAVASTLISFARDREPDLGTYAPIIKKLLDNFKGTYQAMHSLLQTIEPKDIYLFNGRFTTVRAAASAAESLGIDVHFHERVTFHSYVVSKKVGFHNMKYFAEVLKECANQMASTSGAKEVASEWFETKRRGSDKGLYIFVKPNEHSELPEGFDPKKRNIVIFNSCEDEYIVYESWGKSIFEDQYSGIKYLTDQFIDKPNFHFYLRVHPRLLHDDNTQTRQLKKLNQKNLTIIPAEANINSYRLVDACEKVVTFGSTIGIEAVYWNTPSILLGPAKYQSIGCCPIPQSPEQAISLLSSELKADKDRALVWGYYIERGGFPFEHLHPGGAKEAGASYRGQRLIPNMRNRLWLKSWILWERWTKKRAS